MLLAAHQTSALIFLRALNVTFYANNRLLYNLTKPSVCTEEISSHSHTKGTHLCSSFVDQLFVSLGISFQSHFQSLTNKALFLGDPIFTPLDAAIL